MALEFIKSKLGHLDKGILSYFLEILARIFSDYLESNP